MSSHPLQPSKRTLAVVLPAVLKTTLATADASRRFKSKFQINKRQIQPALPCGGHDRYNLIPTQQQSRFQHPHQTREEKSTVGLLQALRRGRRTGHQAVLLMSLPVCPGTTYCPTVPCPWETRSVPGPRFVRMSILTIRAPHANSILRRQVRLEVSFLQATQRRVCNSCKRLVLCVRPLELVDFDFRAVCHCLSDDRFDNGILRYREQSLALQEQSSARATRRHADTVARLTGL